MSKFVEVSVILALPLAIGFGRNDHFHTAGLGRCHDGIGVVALIGNKRTDSEALNQPVVIYTATVVLLLWGAADVLSALRKGLDGLCVYGAILKVPLSTVALVEDGGMAAWRSWRPFCWR